MVDPRATERNWVSPYNISQNNPVNRIDPDGALDEPVGGDIGMMIGAAVIGVKHSFMNLVYNAGDGLGITPAGKGMKWEASQAFSEGENRYVSVMNKVPMQGLVKDAVGTVLDGLNVAGAMTGTSSNAGLVAKATPNATLTNEVVQTAKEGLAGAKAAQKSVVKGTAPDGVNRIDIPKLDPNGKPLHGQQSHAHVTVGKQKAAVNQDGSYKHGDASLTQKIKNFLTDHGWKF